MYRNTTQKRSFLLPVWTVGLACLLSGCIALPGQEPFGERTYPVEQAQAVYEKLSADMEQQEFMDQSGYIIQIRPFILSEDVSDFDTPDPSTGDYFIRLEFAGQLSALLSVGASRSYLYRGTNSAGNSEGNRKGKKRHSAYWSESKYDPCYPERTFCHL